MSKIAESYHGLVSTITESYCGSVSKIAVSYCGSVSTVAESAMKHPLYKVKLAVRTSCAYFNEFELEPRTLSPFEKALSIRMWQFPLGHHPGAPGTTVPTPVITAVLWTSCGFLVQSHVV